MLGDGEGAVIGVAAALNHLRRQAGFLHRVVDGFAAAVDEHRLHADIVHEDDVGEDGRKRRIVVDDRPADLYDDDLVVETLDIRQRFDEPGGFVDGDVDHEGLAPALKR